MYSVRLIVIGLSFSMLVFPVSSIWAQAPATHGEPQPMWPKIPSLQFPGGTLGDYVKTLQEVGGPMNIMIASPEAREIKLPPIKLQSVALSGAIELLSGKYQLTDRLFAHISIEKLGDLADNSAVPVYRINLHYSGMPRSVQVRVWNIQELLGDQRKPEAVLTAVETAVGLNNDADQPAKIRYHEDTALLMASGEPGQLEAIDKVINGIRGGVRSSREQVTTAGETEAIAGLFEWIEGMRRFDAEQKDKDRSHDQTAARVEELTRLLENVRGDLQQKDRKIQELERRLQERDHK